MTRVKQLAVITFGVVIAGAMIWLGLWQASTFRTQGHDATLERARQPAVALPSNATGNDVASLYGRQVTVTGRYLPEYQYYVGGKPPLRIVTAFRTDAGQVLAVVRGEVDDGTTPTAPPAGTVSQSGLLMPSEKDFHGTMATGLPTPVIPTVKLERLAQEWPTPLLNGFVTLTEQDAKAQSLTPATVVLPEGEGSQRNAGYALQWWVFAGFALVMTFIWARMIGRQASRPGRGPARLG